MSFGFGCHAALSCLSGFTASLCELQGESFGSSLNDVCLNIVSFIAPFLQLSAVYLFRRFVAEKSLLEFLLRNDCLDLDSRDSTLSLPRFTSAVRGDIIHVTCLICIFTSVPTYEILRFHLLP